jgi:hypothetical protein
MFIKDFVFKIKKIISIMKKIFFKAMFKIFLTLINMIFF